MLKNIAIILTENKIVDVIEFLKNLTDIDKYCLNKFCGFDFYVNKHFTTTELWINSAIKGYTDVVEFYINDNIDVNVKNIHTNSALIYSTYYGNVEIVKLLLQHPKIDVNIQNDMGYTALMYATLYKKLEIINFLLQHKDIDINIKNGFDRCSSHYCDVKTLEAIPKNFM